MPKTVTPAEFDYLVGLIARYPEGVTSEVLLPQISPPLTLRSLQRRLTLLIKHGRIVQEGRTKGRKYRAAIPGDQAPSAFPAVSPPSADEAYIPASPEGQEIREHVRQPLHRRRPVSYNLAFLEAYHPNQTHYLSTSLREQLHTLGRTPEEGRPAGTFARDILNRLLIDLSWASSRLEGNTYSRLDTERLIVFSQVASNKDVMETQMVLNHKSAIEYLVSEAEQIAFTPPTILQLHALLSDSLLPDPSAVGRLRRRSVGIGGSVYLPIDVPQRLEELFGIVIGMAAEIKDPFEQAFFAMVHLPYLQPFEDVNKRVSRLAANIPLIKHNLCPLSFIGMPEGAYVDGMLGVYELNRVELLRDVFFGAYARSCQQYVAVQQRLVPPDPFKLRHRNALSEVIRAIVQGGLPADDMTIRSLIPPSVASADHDRLVALVLAEFAGLHEHNVVRFRLRPLEFVAWQEGQGTHRGGT